MGRGRFSVVANKSTDEGMGMRLEVSSSPFNDAVGASPLRIAEVISLNATLD